MNTPQELLLSVGTIPDTEKKIEMNGWSAYRFEQKSPFDKCPVILIKDGPKNPDTIKKFLNKRDYRCFVVISEAHDAIILKSNKQTSVVDLPNESTCLKISKILRDHKVDMATTYPQMLSYMQQSIKAIPHSTSFFDNRGLFSTHYLNERILHKYPIDKSIINYIKEDIDKDTNKLLEHLGWDLDKGKSHIFKEGDSCIRKDYNNTSILVTKKDDLALKTDDCTTPSSEAVSTISDSSWVILTNGKKWRLYSSRVSASSTNYLEITLDQNMDTKTLETTIQYLVILFGYNAFAKDNQIIDEIFDQSKNLARELEDNLAEAIMSSDGLFLKIIKGILSHDGTKIYSEEELKSAKESALTILYRIWFLAYAESRGLLPVDDERYKPISLRHIHYDLDSYQNNPNDIDCWESLVNLFEVINLGNKKYNVPQYNGDLFKYNESIDKIQIKNKFIAEALRDLLEKDGKNIDYTDFSVRHLGSIFESLMEFNPKQAKYDMYLLQDSKGIREVKTTNGSTYQYKEGDLYLASKTGIATRKTTASYYTNDEIVTFLVKQGLKPIFAEREKHIKDDIKQYEKNPNDKNLNTCIDRLLDIQVLDPAMGSGHFLVEALNQITLWVTEMLTIHKKHPLLSSVESSRIDILDDQAKNGIQIDERMLIHDVILKRLVMKRCIFGVDLNPMAVNLAKVSLWLDSFAIGVPLTFLDHHIKHGDTSIGVRLDKLRLGDNETLDKHLWDVQDSSHVIENISHSGDLNIQQIQTSKQEYSEYKTKTRPQKVLLDIIATTMMEKKILAVEKQKGLSTYFSTILKIVSGEIKNTDPNIDKILEIADHTAKSYSFFHWDLEMMDAFTNTRNGFDLIIGNPPWDKIRPNKIEFFEERVPGWKKKSSTEQNKFKKQYAKEYKEYKDRLTDKRVFFKNYGGIGRNTDFEIYRIILERMLEFLAPNGMLSMVMPSAIVNSRGATELRKTFLEMDIQSLYVFANHDNIFPIDTRTRFALLTVCNRKGSNTFPGAFWLYNTKSLFDNTIEREKFHILSKKSIKKLSPDMSMIYEIRHKKELEIIKKIYKLHPKLSNTSKFTVELGRELNMGEEKDQEMRVNHGGWPVIESKNFHQHIHNYSKPKDHVDITKASKRARSVHKFHSRSDEIHKNPRLVYRSTSSSTNTRTMISALVPASVFTSVGTYMAIPRIGLFDINPNYHKLNAYMCGIFNSTTYDFLLKPMVDKSVYTYMLENIPVPENFDSKIGQKISYFSAILTVSETWHQDMADAFSINKNDLDDNTLKRRIEIVARIDALCALHYGINRQEYEYILSGFKFNEKSFNNSELTSIIQYDEMPSSERDAHMRKFYGHVYKLVLGYYDEYSKGVDNT